MATFEQNLNSIKTQRQQLANAQNALYTARLNIQRDEKPRDLASVKGVLAPAQQNVIDAEKNLRVAIADLSAQSKYTDIANQLDAQTPVLFFPLRMETRLVDVKNKTQLWIRIYPDDIHIHSFEPLLTRTEFEYGKTYWLELLKANREKQDTEYKQTLWQNLVGNAGVQRALWIAKSTQPENWQADITLNNAQLTFPQQKDEKTHSWTRAPQTQILPDRFVVQIHNDSRRKNDPALAPITGQPVADTVFAGPDPFLAEEAFKKDEKGISLDDSFAWISDFEKAVQQGLGFKIEIKEEYLNKGVIDRISVMGLMASADPQESQKLLESHIQSLRYSKGFSFLKQGMATNNTALSGSAYNENADDLSRGYYDGAEETIITNDKQSDGYLLASNLGIDPALFNNVRHAEKKEVEEARAMSTALYPATIGNFVEVLSSPALSETAQNNLHNFFVNHVNATGPLSSIRVGNQPYGILLTSNMKIWKESSPFYSTMSSLLGILQEKWHDMMKKNVAHVNKRGDASKLLLEILGLNAGSVSFKQRLANLNDFSLTLSNLSSISDQLIKKQTQIMDLLRSCGYSATRFPFISNLSFYNKSEAISDNLLVDRKKPAKDRFLDKLGTKKINFIEWLGQVKSISELDRHRLPGGKPPRSVLYFLLRHSLLLELQKAAVKIYNKNGFLYRITATEKSLYNFDRKVQDLTSWEILQGAPRKVDAKKFNFKSSMGDHLLKLRANNRDARSLTQYRKALKSLKPLSTSRLHQTLVDHLDLCSYRLDAWQTGLFYRRLKQQRKRKSEGLYLGAYGWVENLKISTKTTTSAPKELIGDNKNPVYKLPGNAGFVHTPSLNHATAAGMLLAGYTANASESSPDTFAVNLSSARVRKAKIIYEGIQNGQPLEVLLGYQFERALHEITLDNATSNNLNQYTLSLRERFPIEYVCIAQRGSEAQEALPVYNVVDGLKLIDAQESDFSLLNISAAHFSLILKEIDKLADTLDAMGDLLTSESAFQMVQGKTGRTAAIFNSLQDAVRAPELEVSQTPRSTHLQVKNKVCIQFSSMENQPLSTGWPKNEPENGTPRSILEKGINTWLGNQAGEPKNIQCIVSMVDEADIESNSTIISLADLELQPIDLVYMAGTDVQAGAQVLEQQVFQYALRTLTLPDGSRFKIQFANNNLPANVRSFSQLLPLLKLLRLLITTGYAASAKDFYSQPGKVNESADALYVWQTDELKTRASWAISQLKALINGINNQKPDNTAPENYQLLFKRYYDNGKNIEVLTNIQLNNARLNPLIDFVKTADLFGIQASIPEITDSNRPSSITELLLSAAFVWSQSNAKLQKAEAALLAEASATRDDVKVKHLCDAIQSVVGDGFITLPKFKFSNAADVARTVKESGSILMKFISEKNTTSASLALETWMSSTSAVRPAMARLEQIRMITEFHQGGEMNFIPAQLPYKENDNWLSVEFPQTDSDGEPFEVLDDTVSLCIYGLQESNVSQPQAVLIVDEWTESVPNASEVTGISYNYNQPNSTAPNALLLAVEPSNAKNWSWQVLEDILDDTLNRAKTRAVEPAHLLADPALDTLTPMTVASFDLQSSGLSLDYLIVNNQLLGQMNISKYRLYNDFDLSDESLI